MSSKKNKIRAALETAKQALATNENPGSIGDLVWSDPVSNWSAPAETVRDAFTLAGLDPDVLLPAVPDYGTAFSRSILAWRAMIQGRGYTLLAAGYGPNGESRYSVLAVARNGTVNTHDVACVQCPKDGTAPFVERSSGDVDADEIASSIVRASKERYQRYTSDDVRQAFLATLRQYRAQSTRVSAPHTHYWVPSAGVPAMRALGKILSDLGWGTVDSFEGAMTPGNIATVSNAVNNSLEAEIAEYAAEVAAYAISPQKAFMTDRRIQEGNDLRERGELYKGILGQGIVSIDDRIAEVMASLSP
jgi:hypothetical protein